MGKIQVAWVSSGVLLASAGLFQGCSLLTDAVTLAQDPGVQSAVGDAAAGIGGAVAVAPTGVPGILAIVGAVVAGVNTVWTAIVSAKAKQVDTKRSVNTKELYSKNDDVAQRIAKLEGQIANLAAAGKNK